MKHIEGLKSAIKNINEESNESGSGMQSEPKHDIYAPASEGPFKCANCEYFRAPTTCTQPYIVKVHGPDVEAEACCDLYEKKEGK